ncbi:MAG: hypothetical protein WHS87_11460 [Anaerolineales bacterium]
MSEEEERQRLLSDMHGRLATLDEVRAVMARQRDWLKRHPDDREVLESGESLVMLERAFVLMRR